jgi:hypothetical protein
MGALKEQFLEDDQGKKIAVVMPIARYNQMIEDLEDMEDVKLYDQAKEEDSGERVSFSNYLKGRISNNA